MTGDERPNGTGPGAGADRRARHDLAHDLRNPLAVAVGRLQLTRRRMRKGGIDLAAIDAELEAVEAALVRLKLLIDRVDGA